ncbi:MAG: DNA polymerase III subunit delta [Candidatus Erwinia impunctatus]|nr:DNA polymerase III subunit delta [Culicoides impunctatus]
MIKLPAGQLAAQLREGLRSCYLLTGNDPLLLQEAQDQIRQQGRENGFDEHITFAIEPNTDWNEVFSHCHSLSLFSSRQSLLLIFPESGLSAPIASQLEKLTTQLHDDLLLILRITKVSKAQENSHWFKSLPAHSVQVICQTPDHAQLPRWVAQRVRQKGMTIDDEAIRLLCYCYEGNLLGLSQALERLSLLWPDGKLSLLRVEQDINDAAHFTPFQWVDALLEGKAKRALHILRQMKAQDEEPLILLRTVQREVMLLITLQTHRHSLPLRQLFDQHRVWQNRRPMLENALSRLTITHITRAVALLTTIELTLKQDYGHTVWQELEALSLLLTQALPTGVLDDY